MMWGKIEVDFFGDGRFGFGILADAIELILSDVVQRVNLAGKRYCCILYLVSS